MYRWQHVHIFNELNQHDCAITIFNPLQFPDPQAANEELLLYIKRNRFDLFMTPHGHDDIFGETILEIKKKSIPTLLFCCDNLVVPFMHEKNAQYFDLIWLTSKETGYIFKKWNSNLLVLPYAANPYYFYPKYNTEIKKVVFIGTPYGNRKYIINKLVENHIPVCLYANVEKSTQKSLDVHSLKYSIYSTYNLSRFKIGRKILLSSLKHKVLKNGELNVGNPYLEIKRVVELFEMDSLISNFSLSLSFTTALKTGVLKNPVPIINLRSFEIPMSGGLQLCSFNEELANYFTEDQEIVFFRNDEELISKANYYLRPENEKIRMKMKIAARKRAENEHTWVCRFGKIFDKVGLFIK